MISSTGLGLRCLLCLLLTPAAALAQETPPTPRPGPAPAVVSNERPGLIKVGPLFVTPFLRLNSAGLDTNVFYTATDRRIDGQALGGPGLDVVLPAGDVRFLSSGGIDYLYFVRTKSQRHLGGSGRARLEWNPGRLRAGIEQAFAESFERPSLEVDQRVLSETWTTHGDVALTLPGRLGIVATANSARQNVPESTAFRGTDLQRTLSRDEQRFTAGLRYHMTLKTAALLEGDQQMDRFKRDPSRDADSNRLYAGLEISSATRLAGRAVGGARFFRPRGGGPREVTPYASIDLSYQFHPRTVVRTAYERDLAFSAFDTTGTLPTLRNERAEVRLEKGLFGRFVIDVYGGYTRLLTNGSVTLTTETGPPESGIRDDTAWSGGADFGYQFRSRVRIGVAATYLDRRSNFQDLGIHGVLVGGTVRYTPHN